MEQNLFEEFKHRVSIRYKGSSQCECGGGINIFVRTHEEAERLVKAFDQISRKSDWRVGMHITLKNARSTFYPLALLCFFGLACREIMGEYDITSAIMIMVIFWGLVMVVTGGSCLFLEKRSAKKALENEIKELTGDIKNG